MSLAHESLEMPVLSCVLEYFKGGAPSFLPKTLKKASEYKFLPELYHGRALRSCHFGKF